MYIGERIRTKREMLKMSQDELAQKVGYKSRSSINKIELGLNEIPQSKILLFSTILNMSPSELMGWEKKGSNYALGIELENILQEISDELNISYADVVDIFLNINNPERMILNKDNVSKIIKGYLSADEETPAIKPVERKLTDNQKIFLEEINDLTEEEQQKVLDFIHFTKSQRTKRINLSPGTELAAFGGDFVSKPKKKKPEIL